MAHLPEEEQPSETIRFRQKAWVVIWPLVVAPLVPITTLVLWIAAERRGFEWPSNFGWIPLIINVVCIGWAGYRIYSWYDNMYAASPNHFESSSPLLGQDTGVISVDEMAAVYRQQKLWERMLGFYHLVIKISDESDMIVRYVPSNLGILEMLNRSLQERGRASRTRRA